jgi:hypothetical protein
VSIAPPGAPQVPGSIPCPRCAATVGPDQEWCLECGAPARTRLVPTPNWRAPIAVLAIVILLAGIALALAFVSLTNDSEPAPPVNSQAPPPSATAPATTAAPTTAAPTTAAPTTTAPATGASTATGSTTGTQSSTGTGSSTGKTSTGTTTGRSTTTTAPGG